MSHPPFESWLLSEEPLNPDQQQALQAHLSGCAFCRRLAGSWPEVHRYIRSVPPVRPAAGFAARWQDRLAAERLQERLRQQRRQSWGALFFTAGMAAFLLLLLLVQVAFIYRSPEQLLFAGALRIAELLSFANLAQELLLTLPNVLLTAIPPVWWAVSAAVLGLLCLVWILSLRRIMLPRRVTP
jgi:hypothetical protein